MQCLWAISFFFFDCSMGYILKNGKQECTSVDNVNCRHRKCREWNPAKCIFYTFPVLYKSKASLERTVSSQKEPGFHSHFGRK